MVIKYYTEVLCLSFNDECYKYIDGFTILTNQNIIVIYQNCSFCLFVCFFLQDGWLEAFQAFLLHLAEPKQYVDNHTLNTLLRKEHRSSTENWREVFKSGRKKENGQPEWPRSAKTWVQILNMEKGEWMCFRGPLSYCGIVRVEEKGEYLTLPISESSLRSSQKTVRKNFFRSVACPFIDLGCHSWAQLQANCAWSLRVAALVLAGRDA